MTFSIDNPEGGCNNPPLGKYVWEKPSGEQGLTPLFNPLQKTSVFKPHSVAHKDITRGVQIECGGPHYRHWLSSTEGIFVTRLPKGVVVHFKSYSRTPHTLSVYTMQFSRLDIFVLYKSNRIAVKNDNIHVVNINSKD